MTMIPLLAALALTAAITAPRFLRDDGIGLRLESAGMRLRRVGPVIVAIMSILVVWYAWDFAPFPKVHDEVSYLLQAELFARGRWTAPSPPIPEFFEQPHVQVVPAVASKYPPGHALLLALGALVGVPTLIPLLLTGATAALLFALTARVSNAWIALLTWAVWITAPIVLRFQPSYFSEVTTAALMLASWWALLSWREERRRRWLLLLALAVGWGAITRPLTMLALAIPIGVVVLRDVHRLRLWRDLGLGVAAGVAVLSILPLWSARTTGDWRVNPVEKYRLDYLPFDRMGFTADTSLPRRGVAPPLRSAYDYNRWAHQQHTIGALPRVAWDRVMSVTSAFFQGNRLPLMLAAIAGLFFMRGPFRFAAVSALAVFVAYLPYAYWREWTLYYLEATPALSALTALGLWSIAERAARSARGASVSAALSTAVVIAFAPSAMNYWRRDHRVRTAVERRFFTQLEQVPGPAIVFVKYSPRTASHVNVVRNFADLASEPVWVVHHMGSRNDELRRLAPNRQSFDFDEEQLLQRPPR